MFDPRDISSDPRTLTPQRPQRDYLKERQDRTRTGSRTERAVAEIGMYRTVAYKDLSEAHFDGHPYATRRAVDRMIQQGDVQEQTAKGPQGGTYKVLTLTGKGVRRAEVAAQDQGLDSGQKAWSGMVKSAELQHDTAVFRAARVEKAAELGLPVKAGKVEYPDAQLEYDLDGRSGRVNVEIATEHYSAKSIGAKAAAGFAVHGSNGRAKARVARALGRDDGNSGGGGGGKDRDPASFEL